MHAFVALSLLLTLTPGQLGRSNPGESAEFDRQRKTVDLLDTGDVNNLVRTARRNGLVKREAELLQASWNAQFKKAGKDEKALRALMAWCGAYSLDESRRKTEGELVRVEYPRWVRAAGDDAKKLLDFAIRCRNLGLLDEAKNVEAMAIARAPEDRTIREALGFERDELGKWVRRAWKVRVVSSKLSAGYLEQEIGGDPMRYIPPRRSAVAIVTLEMTALQEDPEAMSKFRERATEMVNRRQATEVTQSIRTVFPPSATTHTGLLPLFDVTGAEHKLIGPPSRFLDSKSILLTGASGKPFKLVTARCHRGALGVLVVRSRIANTTSVKHEKGISSPVYLRMPHGTLTLLNVGQTMKQTYVFVVPKSLRECDLSISDSHSVKIVF